MITKLEQHRQTWQGKSDEWLFERLALELTQKVEEIHKLLAENEQLRLGAVVRSRLSPGDKLICWAKGAAYGDTFTVQDSMYEEGMILQCDKYGSWTPLKDVDLSEFDYADKDGFPYCIDCEKNVSK